MKHLFKNPLFYVCLILFLAVGFLVVDFVGATTSFSEPTEPFPGGNPELPIDISPVSQTKEGELTVNELIITPAGNLYLNGSGICMKESVSGAITCKNYWNQMIKWSNATDGIYYSGKVGIATTTPNYTLDVAGDINLSGTLYQNGSELQTGYWEQTGSDIYYNSGSVGIGKTNPSKELDVVGDILASGTICDSTGCIGSGGSSLWTAYSGYIAYEDGNAHVKIEGTSGEESTPSLKAYLELNTNIDYRGRGVLMTTRDDGSPAWYMGVPYTGEGFTIGRDDTQPEYKANSLLFITEKGTLISKGGGTISNGRVVCKDIIFYGTYFDCTDPRVLFSDGNEGTANNPTWRYLPSDPNTCNGWGSNAGKFSTARKMACLALGGEYSGDSDCVWVGETYSVAAWHDRNYWYFDYLGGMARVGTLSCDYFEYSTLENW